MLPKSPKLLDQIRDAAAFIREVTRAKNVKDFENDRLLRQAVERNLEIIGEAVGRLARDDAATADQSLASHHERSVATGRASVPTTG